MYWGIDLKFIVLLYVLLIDLKGLHFDNHKLLD